MVVTATAAGKRSSLVVLTACHVERAAVFIGNGLGQPDMVRVHVCTDDALDWLPTQFAAEHVMPEVQGLLVVQSRVNDIPTVCVFQQIQVDVRERPAHWHGDPANARRNFDGRATRRMG